MTRPSANGDLCTGESVLHPLEQRRGVGIELNSTFASLARDRLATKVQDLYATNNQQQIIEGDVRDIIPSIPSASVDFLVTSPPHWNILQRRITRHTKSAYNMGQPQVKVTIRAILQI